VAEISEIITLLEREAAAEREQVLADARARAEAIRAEARGQAADVLASTRARLEAEERAAVVKAQSTARLRAASLVLQAKEEEISRVFARAGADLAGLAQNGQHYPAALRRFIEEGLRGIPGRAVVAVNPVDQAAADALVRERGWDATVRPDPSVEGGVRISSPDGRFVVTNTLASRLDRARPALAAEVARTLWE
jgi:V/A-type H+-transporting ATPase subunit E